MSRIGAEQDDIPLAEALLLNREESTNIPLANERKHAAALGGNRNAAIRIDRLLHEEKQKFFNLLLQ
jgi:hypothetical protein